MILVDTSAWVEYLRATGSAIHQRLHALLQSDESLATTEVVVMEVLAGARDEAHFQRLHRMLFECDFLSMTGLADYEDAATLYRRCRQVGSTPRSLTDCLIAAVAIRADVELLHVDRDFELIAKHSPLRLAG